MKHIIVTRCFFDDDELFNKYFKIMKLVYGPSIKSQINNNFEIGFIISPKHSDKISELNLNIPVLFFDSVKSFNEYCFEKNIEIQTRHDCDDWMRNDYIENIQKQYHVNSKKYNSFLIQSQIYKHDIDSDKLYKPKLDYDDKNTSMFLSLCQKKVTSCVLDDNHRFMYKLVDKVIDLGYGYVKLTIHNNNKLSTILSGDQFIGKSKIDISIIIPTFNNVEYIDECINSIIKSCNNYNYEILIGIDNCSKTYNHIVKKYDLHNYNLQFYFFNKNVGPYIIKNSLIEKTNSDNILFFDSDDIIMENSIKLIIDNLNNFDMVRFKFYNFHNNLTNLEISTKHADGVFAINKKLFVYLNGYEPWMCGADSEMVWRVQSNNKKIKLINDCLFYRRRHNNSLTVKSETNDTSQIRAKYRSILNDKKIRSKNGPLNSITTHPNYKITSTNPIKEIIYKPIPIIPNNVVILSTLWNAKKFIPQFVNSIKSQTYKNFIVYVVDDNSNDGSYETLVKLTSGDIRFKIFKNTSQKFKTQNFYEIINNNQLISDNDIIIELDGDDEFYGKNVIEKVVNHFRDPNLWIAGYKWIDNRGQKSPFKYPPNADNPRSQVWSYSAMRVFKAFLFRNIKQSDLMFEGNFVRAANDIAYGMPMLEMSGKEHFKSFNDITYLYNWHDKNTHNRTSSVRDTGLQKRTEKHIYSLPRYKKLTTNSTVIFKQNDIVTPKVTNVANTEKISKIKNLVPGTQKPKTVDKIIPEPREPQKVENKVPKIVNNNNIRKITSQILTTSKKEININSGVIIKDKPKIEVPENVQTKNTPKIQFDTLIIKTQNKIEIDEKRKNFENMVLYTPKGKKEIKQIPPKNIGIGI
jgi:glycosyltransferase involved in cell wall biosynthesis